MAGVEAQVRVPRVGLVEEAVDLAGGADVTVGVRVELLLDAELLEQRLAEPVVAGGELRPLLVGEGAAISSTSLVASLRRRADPGRRASVGSGSLSARARQLPRTRAASR